MRAKLICKRYTEEEILAAAEMLLEKKIRAQPVTVTSPSNVSNYLRACIGAEEREHFGVLYLDAQHNLLSNEVLFSGSTSVTTVYPREVVKRGLSLNASAAIIYHNHPSGNPDPSHADRTLTATLKDVLKNVDIDLLDHFIVGPMRYMSFAERGYL